MYANFVCWQKKKRYVGAIHCGRKGLEKKIIKNFINIFQKKGCSKEDILVAIGPSISKKNYLLDYKTLNNFYKQVPFKGAKTPPKNASVFLNFNKLVKFKNQDLIPFNIKKSAYIQLLDEDIPNLNIDISSLCTYESSDEFYSWRRSKTYSRQWNFICQ